MANAVRRDEHVANALRVARNPSDKVLTGVAAGIGDRLGIQPDLVRAAFVTLTFAAGTGIALYVALWMVSVAPDGADPSEPASPIQVAGLLLALVGVLIALREARIWFGDELVWPVGLVAFGIAAMWSRAAGDRQDWLARMRGDEAKPAAARVALGAVVILAGSGMFLSSFDAFRSLGSVLLAAIVTGVGLLLVFGPWVWRLGRDLTRERRDRIRTEERAEMAAHLHDSVLQTLSLIQRSADPREMVVLARAQERELRSWLFGAPSGSGQDRLGGSLAAVAARVEADHKVPIEVVSVGDDPTMDDGLRAMVLAVGEAATNAAKHSGTARVSVYVEANDGAVEAWVTDHGSGFDPAAVSPDRAGIAESIVARMDRVAGSAEVTTNLGEGTEVHLKLVTS